MAIKGLTTIKLALVDDDQKIIAGKEGLSESGIYTVDTKDMGTKTANITGMEGTLTKVYGNNFTQDVMIGASAPTVALDINNLDFVIRNKILGNQPDEKGGFVYDGTKPNVALIVETRSVKQNARIFFGFGNGVVSMAAQNIATNTEAEAREDDALTYTALSTNAFGGEPMKTYIDSVEKFDEDVMMAEIFGGYTGTTRPKK